MQLFAHTLSIREVTVLAIAWMDISIRRRSASLFSFVRTILVSKDHVALTDTVILCIFRPDVPVVLPTKDLEFNSDGQNLSACENDRSVLLRNISQYYPDSVDFSGLKNRRAPLHIARIRNHMMLMHRNYPLILRYQFKTK